MSPAALTFRPVPGVLWSEIRAIGFLEGSNELDADRRFQKLKESKRQLVLDSMDAWVGGSPDIQSRFHGWYDDPEFWMLYAFKARVGNVRHRIYGYLCNPLPHPDSRFRVCVLCIYALKTQQETDHGIKRQIKNLSQRADVLTVVRKAVLEELENAKKAG